jgi:hypothetical protein
MHAHQRLNRLDDPLGVANEIAPGLVEQHGMGARKRFQARRPSPGCRAGPPGRPAMTATGAARISGHGVAATNTATLRIRSTEIS